MTKLCCDWLLYKARESIKYTTDSEYREIRLREISTLYKYGAKVIVVVLNYHCDIRCEMLYVLQLNKLPRCYLKYLTQQFLQFPCSIEEIVRRPAACCEVFSKQKKHIHKMSHSIESTRVAIVTGANRGLGFETAKKLCKAGIETILACRHVANGEAATAKLRKISSKVYFKELDVANAESRSKFVEEIRAEYGCIDILVNNAGIILDCDTTLPSKEEAHCTLETNYFGLYDLCEQLLPLLRKGSNATLVNVASEDGHLTCLQCKELRSRFCSNKLTIDELNSLVREYLRDIETGAAISKGWSNSSYAVSKCAVIALTKILSRQPENKGVLINCCCPGYCKTDMNEGKGVKSAEEGARTIAMLALLPKNSNINGKFYQHEQEIEW